MSWVTKVFALSDKYKRHSRAICYLVDRLLQLWALIFGRLRWLRGWLWVPGGVLLHGLPVLLEFNAPNFCSLLICRVMLFLK